jgi:hypothetical protein
MSLLCKKEESGNRLRRGQQAEFSLGWKDAGIALGSILVSQKGRVSFRGSFFVDSSSKRTGVGAPSVPEFKDCKMTRTPKQHDHGPINPIVRDTNENSAFRQMMEKRWEVLPYYRADLNKGGPPVAVQVEATTLLGFVSQFHERVSVEGMRLLFDLDERFGLFRLTPPDLPPVIPGQRRLTFTKIDYEEIEQGVWRLRPSQEIWSWLKGLARSESTKETRPKRRGNKVPSKVGRPRLGKSRNEKDKLKANLYQNIRVKKAEWGVGRADLLDRLKNDANIRELAMDAGVLINSNLIKAAVEDERRPRKGKGRQRTKSSNSTK